MHRNIYTSVIATVVVGASALFVFVATNAVFYAPQEEISVPAASSLVAPTESAPARMQIPSLNIDARVQHVGITTAGDMANPTNYRDVGWYKYGPVPGQRGSAVIDGHVDNGLALAGVFKKLATMRIGDSVYIIAQDGSALHFVVSDIARYPYKDAPRDLIFAQNDAARLNLITCAGLWIASKRTYDERLVVYTKLVDVIIASST